jgi:hypothetical protein
MKKIVYIVATLEFFLTTAFYVKPKPSASTRAVFFSVGFL